MKKTIFMIIALTISYFVQAQINPNKIKSKTDYAHSGSGLIFPLKIDQFSREDIYSFDKKKENIKVSYKSKDFKTTVSIYLYPAGDGTEIRLRDEYLKSVQFISNYSDSIIITEQFAVSFKIEDYKINGFKANIIDNDISSSLSVFECGKWFFKIWITSDNLDAPEEVQIENNFLDFFNPSILVKNNPLNTKAEIFFGDRAYIDSLTLISAMGSALKKVEWAMENVDASERASGFPGLYLEMHVASLKEFVEVEKKYPGLFKTKRTEEYLIELNKIINSGFLEEFIMEQFKMIMIVPNNLDLDFDNYYRWKLSNPISIDLNERFYLILYRE